MNLEDSINDREIPTKQLLKVLLEHFNAGRYIESENLLNYEDCNPERILKFLEKPKLELAKK